jgi:hypothetical protein
MRRPIWMGSLSGLLILASLGGALAQGPVTAPAPQVGPAPAQPSAQLPGQVAPQTGPARVMPQTGPGQPAPTAAPGTAPPRGAPRPPAAAPGQAARPGAPGGIYTRPTPETRRCREQAVRLGYRGLARQRFIKRCRIARRAAPPAVPAAPVRPR